MDSQRESKTVKKKCSKCKKTLFLGYFYKKKEGKYGVESTCKACRSLADKAKATAIHLTCMACGKPRTVSSRSPRIGERCRKCCALKRWERDKNPPLTCPICNKTFSWRHSTSRWPRKYCSKECFEIGRAAKVEKICPACKKPFSVPRSNANRYNFCSIACSGSRALVSNCKRCGKEFRYSRTQPERTYCSEECRRPPFVKQCDNCKKNFRCVPAYKNRRFCSFPCYRKYTGETSIEKKVRLLIEALGFQVEREFCAGSRQKDVFDLHVKGLNLLIDCNGDYWHSKPSIKRRDEAKNKRAEKNGYKVVRLPEKLINSKELENTLRLLLGL